MFFKMKVKAADFLQNIIDFLYGFISDTEITGGLRGQNN